MTMTITPQTCATCPSPVLPNREWIAIARGPDYEALLDANVLRGFVDGDDRLICLFCVVTGKVEAER